MGAVTAVGGTALGAGIGYVVGGRSGALVGGLLGSVGGYNVEPLADWFVGAEPADRGSVRAQFRASPGVGGAGGAGGATIVGGRELHEVHRARLRAIGYDDGAEMVASAEGDPFGSFRVRRDLEYELGRLGLLTGAAETSIRAILTGVTAGVSEVLIQTIGASRRAAVESSVKAYPSLLVWSPDYPAASWPYRNDIKVDTGAPFGDRERELQIRLYGPTPADVERASAEGAYIASVRGRPVRLTLAELGGDAGRWGRYVR